MFWLFRGKNKYKRIDKNRQVCYNVDISLIRRTAKPKLSKFKLRISEISGIAH